MDEVYCVERYRGYLVGISLDVDSGLYYGDAYFNGTCLVDNIHSVVSANKCLDLVKEAIDTLEDL